jgi:hypothetical protein
MSAAAVAESNHVGPSGPGALRALLRFPDFILLGVALPVFLIAGWPLLGWAVAAIGWFVQAIVIALMEQRALTASETRVQVGLVVGGSLARAWIAAAAILAAYLAGGEATGLACALLMIVLATVFFANKLISHLTRPDSKADTNRT